MNIKNNESILWQKNITLSMVSKKDDEEAEVKFRALCKELQVKPMVRVFADIGRGETSKDYFQNSTKAPEPKKIITDPVVLEENRKIMQNKLRVSRCTATKTMLYIDSQGDLYPCPLLVDSAYKLTNIADIHHVQEALEAPNLEHFFTIHPEHIGHCKDCKVQAFCITCYELVDRHIKRGTLADYCKGKKEFLYDIIWNT